MPKMQAFFGEGLNASAPVRFGERTTAWMQEEQRRSTGLAHQLPRDHLELFRGSLASAAVSSTAK